MPSVSNWLTEQFDSDDERLLSEIQNPTRHEKYLAQFCRSRTRWFVISFMSGLKEGLRWKLAALPSDKFVKEAMKLGLAVIPTPTEEAYFKALRVPRWPPEERTEQQLRYHKKQTKLTK